MTDYKEICEICLTLLGDVEAANTMGYEVDQNELLVAQILRKALEN